MSSAFKLMEDVREETSLEGALLQALEDRTFHDVTLLASDGVQVPAHRVLLAFRSEMFKAMLMGDSSEAASPTIEVDFPGAVVNAVVEYIYTSKVRSLSELHPGNVEENGDISEANHEDFQTLVTIAAAAAYCNLPKLCAVINDKMETYVKQFPSLSVAVLEACAQERPAISKHLLEMALSNIRHNKVDILKQGILCSLSSPVLAIILSDEKSLAPEYKCFDMVRLWSEGGSGVEENRQALAKELVKCHLKLHWITPDVLADSVAPSGLVDIEQLAEAYKRQAIMAKHQYGVCFEKPGCFSNPIWCDSQTKTVAESRPASNWKSDKLVCPPLVEGCKYKWTIDTTGTKAAENIMIGVAKHSANLDNNTHCGSQCSCWVVCCSTGHAWYSGGQKEFVGAMCGQSHVTVVLDLSPAEANNGSLSISVNGARPLIVTRSMKACLDSSTDGYVPVVSCCSGTSVNIISIKEVC
ncbi:Kelch-like protein 2 [Seminavis robusta]|uniref:Kelch-like protein 2 n=1 Tax=Seminavis robusta TaxID=568900 RepID=A0A9N8DGM3_9STRA|nr:Kelch-like protein 2 [Seminavis robusta]|eukprot:Sro81_g043390.1 Kelch-like protein 2 (469) ;mRNA; r:28319-29725